MADIKKLYKGKAGFYMKKYQVNYTDNTTGATSAIDTITADNNYTAENYINDCMANADNDYCEMLKNGTITLEMI